MTVSDYSPLTPELMAAHGLEPEEYERILALIGRLPTLTELGIFSAMWNEHCSYKSSKKWLKTLPTEGPCVIEGPGENAGVIDIGNGLVCVFKMESHNHPSSIEPYQGAATGMGGILRDVFTMGARPVAALNALRFGAMEHERTRHLLSGVVAGIGGYGNSFGVATVGGEVGFHPRYNGNILVNAMAVGIARADSVFYSRAEGVGMPIVYLGAKTGRDGIHGAAMASAEFTDDSQEKRPTVQVGDPFCEKLLLEACLELMASGAVIAIQDMGAAGLTCSAVEMGAKGNLGVTLDLDKVPCREEGMTAYDMMLSESQERMLMVLRPEYREQAEAVFAKWGLDFAVIGHTTDSLRFIVNHRGQTRADLPIKALGDEAPEYDRPWSAPAKPERIAKRDIRAPKDMGQALITLMSSPDLCSKRWVWEQYDHHILSNTAQHPGGDAAVIAIDEATRGLALSVDSTPRYVDADAFEGGKQAVAECWRNLTAVGARPLAVTDNLNFGNPERPEIMGQFVHAVKGIGEACRSLSFPVVSGNVSLYNETSGRAILPTPVIGGVGLLDELSAMATIGFKAEGEVILLIGGHGAHMGRTLYLKHLHGREDGAPPPIDLVSERRNGDFVRELIGSRRITACHDVSDGGLIVAIAEMAMHSGLGARLDIGAESMYVALFGEDQARYVVTARHDRVDDIMGRARVAKVGIDAIGTVGGENLDVVGAFCVPVARLCEACEATLPRYMDNLA